MNYDDCEYYEPTQADMIMDEFIDKMREALTDAAKDEIERLRRENEELKKYNYTLLKREVDIGAKSRQLDEKEKDLERSFYRKKFNEFLQPFLDNIEVYFASHEPHEQPKCEFCNDERKLIFTASNGDVKMEWCKCAHKKYWREPKKATLQAIEFYKRDWNGKEFIATAQFEPTFPHDDDKYLSVNVRMIVEQLSDETLQMIESLEYRRNVVFTSQEECQKYCELLNKRD